MGAGIGSLDLLQDAEQAIVAADLVMYCRGCGYTNFDRNAATGCPDLTALYNGNQPRHSTYIQMAEAMIAPVRAGKTVVAFYYGHPGIFAAPTHRAIRIAREQGLRAHMRPGISALDYLVADVGFDPAFPGMLSYEASDLLLRGRRIDTTLHLILWQIGVVGEFGYSRNGFRNIGYELLVETLIKSYGETWKACHYIGSRFPEVEPVIEHIPLRDMLAPAVRSSVIPLSTLYIPPKDVVVDNAEAARQLGVLGADDKPATVLPVEHRPLYGAVEKEALGAMASFTLPEHYRQIVPNPAINFFLDMRNDLALRTLYRNDPAALAHPRYASVPPAIKEGLAKRSIRAVQQAVNAATAESRS
jgi:hypothetical protein